MALNNRSIARVMTRFNRLFVQPSKFKEDTADYGVYPGTQLVVVKSPPGQTANMEEFHDYSGNVMAAVDPSGNLIYGGGVALAGGAGKQLKCVQRFPLTAAQIIAMGTTPITIVPAPASTQALLVEQISVELDLTSTAFSLGGVVHFYYHGASTEIMSATLAAATINGGAGQSVYLLQPVQTAGGSVITPAVGLDITNATQAFATGTGTAVVTVWYNVLTLG